MEACLKEMGNKKEKPGLRLRKKRQTVRTKFANTGLQHYPLGVRIGAPFLGRRKLLGMRILPGHLCFYTNKIIFS